MADGLGLHSEVATRSVRYMADSLGLHSEVVTRSGDRTEGPLAEMLGSAHSGKKIIMDILKPTG